MASSPVISWKIEGGNVEVVTDFLFLDYKITADGDCFHEIRKQLPLSRKAMPNLDSVLKSRHYCTDTGQYSQRHGLPSGHVWVWELDGEEGRRQKNWYLQTVVLEKTPESPLDITERKPILREINPEDLLEVLILKLKLQYFGHTMQTADSLESPWCWERLKAEGEDGITGWNSLMASLIQWTWTWVNFGSW